MEAPWLLIVLSMLANILQCPNVKDLAMDVSVAWLLKGLSSLHLILWLVRDVFCADNSSLPQSVRQW